MLRFLSERLQLTIVNLYSEEIAMSEEERGTVAIILREDEDIEKFERVKKIIGIRSNTDVLRFLVNRFLKEQESVKGEG